jgi:hypothetical protein
MHLLLLCLDEVCALPTYPITRWQVTLAVLVSSWAHVLHATYKPWGKGSVLYSLQHGSLLVTSFVFLMGLLFKVNGVSQTSTTYGSLAIFMVALCVGFLCSWLGAIVLAVKRAIKVEKDKRLLAADARRLRQGSTTNGRKTRRSIFAMASQQNVFFNKGAKTPRTQLHSASASVTRRTVANRPSDSSQRPPADDVGERNLSHADLHVPESVNDVVVQNAAFEARQPRLSVTEVDDN